MTTPVSTSTAAVPGTPTADDVRLLGLVARGLATATVARRLGLSERTVRRRLRQVCDVIGVATPIEAVVWAVRRGLL